jgi:hypothetical protein
MRLNRGIAVPALIALAVSGCGSSATGGSAEGSSETAPAGEDLPQGAEPVELDPADFVPEIDNPYWPMRPGTKWVYREVDEEGTEQRVDVEVIDQTKEVAGIQARVVRDLVTEDGQKVEDTDDWYAQDRRGNVWYLGEDTTEFEDGKPVTKAGSFEAGVDGAQAGIAMPAEPEPGMAYRQEYYEGEAEDAARVLSVDDQAEVSAGHYTEALLTKDFNPLEPKVLEYKQYARGVGPVQALQVSDGFAREELLSFERGEGRP